MELNELVLTGLYKTKYSYRRGSLDDQMYGYLLLVRVRDKEDDSTTKYYMIDTYHFSRPSGIVGVDMKRGTYDNALYRQENTVYLRIPYVDEYYYGRDHYFRVTEQNINDFTLVCDLKDFHPVSRDEFNEFSETDRIMHIPLWHECQYDTAGFYLVRNDAKIDYNNKISYLLNSLDFRMADFNAWDYKKLLETVKLANKMNVKYNVKRFRQYKKMAKFIQKQQKEYNDFHHELFCSHGKQRKRY